MRETPRVQALVLNVDSRGGSAAGSDYLFHSLQRVAQRKPVVAFIGGIGASGGYLLACAAHRIVALRTALVGSIGVISMRPILQTVLERLGVDLHVSKAGRLKDSWSVFRNPTEEENIKLQELVDGLYESFVETVVDSRGLSRERVLELATGEVFRASRAVELGLVDELGDLDRALDLAAELAGIPRRYVYLRPRRTLQERLLGPVARTVMEQVEEVVLEDAGLRLYYH